MSAANNRKHQLMTLMNTLRNGKAVAISALVITSLGLLASQAEVRMQSWQFNSAASPVAAEVSTNALGGCTAIVVPGDFAEGWIASNPLLGSASGVWDLGRNGTITCQNLGAMIGGPTAERSFRVKVKQWRDGGIYLVSAGVSATGAVVEKTSTTFTPSGAGIGGWLTEETQWRVPAGSNVDSVQITSAYDGSLVDQVSIETTAAVVQLPPPELTIQRVGDQLRIAWPAGYSTMQLQSSADLQDAHGWTAVDAPIQVSGGTASVTVNTDGSTRFYRLKQP